MWMSFLKESVHGRPLLLGDYLDMVVQAYYWLKLRQAGGVVSAHIDVTSAVEMEKYPPNVDVQLVLKLFQLHHG